MQAEEQAGAVSSDQATEENTQASNAPATTDAEADVLTRESVSQMLEDERKKWQSRFDKVLAEKAAEENKTLTIEQRIQQMEQERKSERLDWTRKEARAVAQIDSELDAAVMAYASGDAEKIASGATALRAIIDGKISDYKTKIDELEKQVKYTGKPPEGGAPTGGNMETKTEYTRGELQDSKIARLVMQRKKAGENITIS